MDKKFKSLNFYSLNRENVKVFLYNHDYFSTCPNGGLFFFNTKTKCNLKPLSKNVLHQIVIQEATLSKYGEF